MRELLLKEHPNWRVPERRVKKFIKRHVNRHQDPSGADDDTVTSSKSAKMGSPVGRALRRLVKPFSSSRNVKTAPPMTIGGGDIPEASPHPAPETPKKEVPKPVEKTPEPEPVPSPTAAETVEVESQDRAAIAYEDDNAGKKDDCECSACVIS
jgi:hypothetical protein